MLNLSQQTAMSSSPTVIKIGGALLADPVKLESFWPSLKELSRTVPIIIVHGGGPQATSMARRLEHEPRIVDGRRVTTDLDLSIIHWTLCGELNTTLTAQALQNGVNAVGLTGIAGGTVRVNRRPPWKINGEKVDFGWVGDVDAVDASLLECLLEAGRVPIVAPLGIDNTGQTYNVNADTIAQSVASALKARSFILVTESGGVRRDAEDPISLLPVIDDATFARGSQEGWIKDGMLVKLKVAFEARKAGIEEVMILRPDDLHSRTRGTRIA
jgi:acetylglutamate kinase